MQRESQDGARPPATPLTQENHDDVNPALRPKRTAFPITPDTYHAEPSGHADEDHSDPPVNVVEGTKQHNEDPSWNSNSCFVSRKTGASEPYSEAAKGARTGEELLGRLSLGPEAFKKRDLADIDPRAAHPNLHLSGQIISVTFCVPYDIGFAPDVVWVREPQMRFVDGKVLTSHRT